MSETISRKGRNPSKHGTLTRTKQNRGEISTRNSVEKHDLIQLSLNDRRIWQRGIKHLKVKDPVMARLIEKAGPIKFEPDVDHYEALVGSIIYQQLAGSAARVILNRFKELYGGRIPSPKEYLATRTLQLRKSGLSPQKISYLKDLSKRLATGKLDLNKLSHLPDEEVIRELDNVRGIGRWTAEMFLIFMLGRTNVLPAEDLGVRKASQRLYHLRKLPERERLSKLAKNWEPYSSIATLYLWKSVEKPKTPAKW